MMLDARHVRALERTSLAGADHQRQGPYYLDAQAPAAIRSTRARIRAAGDRCLSIQMKIKFSWTLTDPLYTILMVRARAGS
jgi:hypothetical protein